MVKIAIRVCEDSEWAPDSKIKIICVSYTKASFEKKVDIYLLS